ncbi:molecular chaperone [Ideonella sp.]|jgi:TorA maturation chaperone TorD|uniref:molecular chaperone n=1 Tax=Ideonella sp. TaxID=1929293 RepID=UPI0037C16DBC
MTAPQALSFATADQAEEGARAELYGVLALLWLTPPSAELLAQFRVAVTEAPEAGAFLQGPWEALVGALRSTTVEQAQDEFDALFGGVGKPDVLVYGSHYLAGFLNEKPLALLRQDMAQLGLQGDAQSGMTEDHIAGVFEVMRYLIAGDDVAVCNLEQQRRFFRTHIQPWAEQLCNAVDAHPRAQLWRAVADMTRAFVQVETQGFDLVE